MFEVVLKLLDDQVGATAIEYGLIGALVSVAAIAAMTAIGGSLNALVLVASSELANASSAGISP
jgi:pilus assembly protein Flp/PilA